MRTRWYRDPLVAFLVLGALLFVIAGDMGEDEQSTIDVRSQDVARLAQQWAMQMQREPNARELQGLLDQYIKEEIYYREALRLGLDENDTIVRRRMVQKLTFLTEDLAVSDVPDQTVLKQFHLDNSDNYTEPKRYSFQHRYFSADRRDDAEQIAERAITDAAMQVTRSCCKNSTRSAPSVRSVICLDANLQLASPICKQTSNGKGHCARLMAGMLFE